VRVPIGPAPGWKPRGVRTGQVARQPLVVWPVATLLRRASPVKWFWYHIQ